MEKQKIGYVITEAPSITTDMKIVKQNPSNRRVTAEVILQDMDVINRNKRIYSKKEMLPALKCERLTELVESGNLFSEEGHPSDPDIRRQQIIDPKLRCCLIEKFWVEGNLIKAHVHGSNLPFGEAFNQDLLDGTFPSFSFRAIGSLNNTSKGAFVENIIPITWDRVIFPSHKKAYVQKLINLAESADINNEDEIRSVLEYAESLGNKVVVSENYEGDLFPIINNQLLDYAKEKSRNYNTVKESTDIIESSSQIINDGRQIQMVSESGDIFIVNLEEKIYGNMFGYSKNNFNYFD